MSWTKFDFKRTTEIPSIKAISNNNNKKKIGNYYLHNGQLFSE